jgi:hypothetical protein
MTIILDYETITEVMEVVAHAAVIILAISWIIASLTSEK